MTSSGLWRAGLGVLFLLPVAACGSNPGVTTTGATSPGAAPTTSAMAPVTASPTVAVEPSRPTLDATPTRDDQSFEAIPEPPAALMSVEGGDPVSGDVGGYTWQQSGQSAPWLPGNPIHVGSLETLRVVLADAVGIDRWTASRVRSENLDGGAIPIGEGSGDRIVFPAPPPGHWSIYVGIWFADNQGDAAYFWAAEVE